MKQKKPIESKPFWYSSKTGQQYAKKVTSDCEYFHSTLEFKLLNQFLSLFPPHRIKRQVPLLYKPATIHYPDLFWKVDFSIELPDGSLLFIEAKGGWINHDSFAMAEFQHKLQYLEFCNRQAWENLYLCSPTEMSIDKFHKVLTPKELLTVLRMRMATLTVHH